MFFHKLLYCIAALSISIAAAQGQGLKTKRITILEFLTGTWCPYCKIGSDSVQAMLSRMPDARMIAHHIGDEMALAQNNSIYDSLGRLGLPSVSIDRTHWQVSQNPPQYSLARLSRWAEVCDSMRQDSARLTINVTGTFDTTTRIIKGAVQLHFLQALQGVYFIHVIISEDSVDYPQRHLGPFISPFYHMSVVRKMTTGTFGVPLTATGFSQNQSVSYNFQDTIATAWKPALCRITVFLDRYYPAPLGHREIQQGYQERLPVAVAFWPVDLISFEATRNGTVVNLTWRTASERNNRGWIIERRGERAGWSSIGFVEGLGSESSGRSYEFRDATAPPFGFIEYRLRQLDMDGTETISRAIQMGSDETPSVVLHQNTPNPFRGGTDVRIELPAAGHIRLNIVDVLGRDIASLADGFYSAGAYRFHWEAGSVLLPNGLYFCRLSTPLGHVTRTMVKTD